MRRIELGAARAGDWLQYASGPRRIVSVHERGVSLVQLRDGRIGSRRHRWSKRTRADGKRTTAWTWQDLKNEKITHAYRMDE